MDKVDDDIGPRLRRWRVSKGLKQQAVAELLGIDQALVSKIERGIRVPGLALRASIERHINEGLFFLQQRLSAYVSYSLTDKLLLGNDYGVIALSEAARTRINGVVNSPPFFGLDVIEAACARYGGVLGGKVVSIVTVAYVPQGCGKVPAVLVIAPVPIATGNLGLLVEVHKISPAEYRAYWEKYGVTVKTI